ncbi:hypothetical protein HanPI659440_Chr12g0476831 [Helianthus annuus]|nr:hypothetical protein HanPI659440_Chr12g0476831 [Helianthus annuus]
MKSIMPPKVFESFAGFFEEPMTGSCPRYEEKKEAVEEMIDVTKELTGDTLKDIADRALMGKLKEGLPRSILSKWIMDSGASRHMTGMLALLYDVKSINGSYVGFAGNQGGRIVGQGTLCDNRQFCMHPYN